MVYLTILANQRWLDRKRGEELGKSRAWFTPVSPAASLFRFLSIFHISLLTSVRVSAFEFNLNSSSSEETHYLHDNCFSKTTLD
jgi:hypothetical protein